MSKDLQQAGIQESHAEAIALAVKQGQGDLATKQDIVLLKSDINWVKWISGTHFALFVGIVVAVFSGIISPIPSP